MSNAQSSRPPVAAGRSSRYMNHTMPYRSVDAAASAELGARYPEASGGIQVPR